MVSPSTRTETSWSLIQMKTAVLALKSLGRTDEMVYLSALIPEAGISIAVVLPSSAVSSHPSFHRETGCLSASFPVEETAARQTAARTQMTRAAMLPYFNVRRTFSFMAGPFQAVAVCKLKTEALNDNIRNSHEK